ncbi:IS1182 family transposase [Pseudonocardia hispaniensis]|uniref:IS1182 family transposase n=1 Tax=Pseudonocardia hispaniensis TaxID=904933 RepID=A0ABW1IWE9_9PSEU
MQGRADPQREILDVESVAGHLLPAGGVFAFLAAHRGELFPDELFADMFSAGRGRPSIPAEVIASVIVLQTLHGLSDEAAAEAVTFDLRWKAACGLAVTAKGFHPTTLTYWRRRLANSQRPNRIFDVIKEVVAATGVLTGKTRRALDSTVLDDAVATQDTVTQLVAAIRRVAREVPGAAGVIAARCSAHDYSEPGKPRIAWDDAAAREQFTDALVGDAHRLLGYLPDQELGAKAAEAVALLALVAGQDVEPADGSDGTDGRWRIARKVAPDRVISTVDPQARHAHKTRSRRHDGYKAHVVVEPDTGIITDTALTSAAGPENSDAAVGIDLLADTATEGERFEVLADSAYGTGDALAALADSQHTPIIKPWPLRPAVEGGFTLDDFTVTEPTGDQPGSVTCPNGITRPITRTRTVTFGAACRGCPFLSRCTTSTRGKKLSLHPHQALQRAHRVRAQDPDFQAVYREHRPMVERSIAWLVAGGNRRLRFRGTQLNDLWLHHRVAGLNLRRLLNLGLTRTAGAWATA